MAKKANEDFNTTSEGLKEYKRPRGKERAKRFYPSPTHIASIQNSMLKGKGLDEIRQKLFQLYEHWDMVLGEDLASLALPLGYRNKIFLIAAEDSMALNELSYSQEEILGRIHAFIDMNYFDKIELHLLQGKTALNQIPKAEHDRYETVLIRPENLGKLNLPEGKVRDAYLHYLSLFEK